ncbi:MAG: M12 family metallo-peptidase, partial [Planctomycetota bacterium]
TAQVVHEDGSLGELAPSVSCFTGYGPDGSEAFLGLRADGLDGYVSLGGELYFLSSGGSPRGRATLAHATAIGGSGSSALRQFSQLVGGPRALSLDTTQLLAVPTLKEADVWIECDRAFRQLFPSNQACIDYATLLITATSEVYRRDLGVQVLIPSGYLRVWNTVAPWGVITDFNHISNVQSWWTSAANPDRNRPRASVHVLTTPVFGGVAWNIGGICDNSQGYEVSSVFGHFPYPIDHTNNDNWDLFVVCHEFGHSFGCQHSFDFAPPITCQDGSGPDSGTIMSYCHLDFGTGAVGMRFHLREQQTIRAYVATRGCIRSRTLLNGDYDGDGARDLDDLFAANALLGRGFRSLGAEESLDMDADLDFDSIDRDLLAASIGAPAASVTLRNGSGLNDLCYFNVNKPVLGTTWEAQIGAFGVGRPTFLLIYDQPHPGLATGFGEMLVLPVSLGGTKLLVHTAVSDGILATHALAIPPDPALVGLAASTQGFVLGGPGGSHFCNALDLVLSVFE